MSFDWVCPHCDRAQTVVTPKFGVGHQHINVDDLAEGNLSIQYAAVGCANADCKKLSLNIHLIPDQLDRSSGYPMWALVEDRSPLFSQTIIPASTSRVQPDYIPAALRDDYYEACAIRDLSPKASATLARRCLQGMIRDFCNIAKSRLIDEISALKTAVNEGEAPAGVTLETVEAIDHVRGVGNIGAHMERDIDLIISVDAGEAQALIDLIEMLFDEWYKARHKRQERLAQIAKIGADKKQAIADGKAAKALPSPE